MTKLTDKQALFVQEYLVDLNATQAAIRAGYSQRTANEIACENLAKPYIQEAIAVLRDERMQRVQINADYVLQRLVEIDQMDAGDILDNLGNLKPIRDWPAIWRQYIAGFEINESAVNGVPVGTIKKIKWPDKIKNIELIGKHIGVGAFKDKVELSVTEDLAGMIAQRRKQAQSQS